MRVARNFITVAVLVGLGAGVASAELVLPRVSPQATVSQTIGTTQVTVAYSRPAVKGRTIWGELVPFGEVWRTGANEATTFAVTDDVTVNGKPLPAGTYSLATIPLPSGEWTVIFSKQSSLWGMYDYKPEEDALRVTAKAVNGAFVERMAFSFENLTESSADVVLSWEKLHVPFTVEVDVPTTTLAKARREVAAAAADDWRTPYMAASYCFQNKLAAGDAAQWLEKSVGIKPTYQNVGLQARMLADAGKTGEAILHATKAIELGKAAGSNTSALEKLLAEWQSTK